MAYGPGPYDLLAAWVMQKAKARGVFLMIIEGKKGNGYEIHLPHDGPKPVVLRMLVRSLRQIADQIEADAESLES